MIYFIQDGPEGPIKVGVAVDVQKRLQSHQASNPRKLSLLKQVAGDYALERRIKKDLKPFRLRGEWYRPAPEVLAYIHKCGCPDYEIHNGQPFAVLYRDDERSQAEPCPFCGLRHTHGVGDGHRAPHCFRGTEQVRALDGTILDRKMGYFIRTRRKG